jgi:hypothetical protein
MAVRKMQVKTMIQYCQTVIRMTKIQGSNNINAGENMEQWELKFIAGKM